MKKYLKKFMALSFAAMLGASILTGCGETADKTETAPPESQTETTNSAQDANESNTQTETAQ